MCVCELHKLCKEINENREAINSVSSKLRLCDEADIVARPTQFEKETEVTNKMEKLETRIVN